MTPAYTHKLFDHGVWWMADALCSRPEYKVLYWFPDEYEDSMDKLQRTVERRRVNMVCAACPVRAECHSFAETAHVTAGIWAGVKYGSTERAA